MPDTDDDDRMVDRAITDAMTERAEELSRRCQAILQGQGQATQSAVLADMLSLWIAGHICVEEIGKPDNERPVTDQTREELLTNFIAIVRKLVPESEKEIMQRIEPQGGA
jgi:hypothetical protein